MSDPFSTPMCAYVCTAAGVSAAIEKDIVIKEVISAAPAVVTKDAAMNAPLALIIEPTRELALQSADVISELIKYIAEPNIRMVTSCALVS